MPHVVGALHVPSIPSTRWYFGVCCASVELELSADVHANPKLRDSSYDDLGREVWLIFATSTTKSDKRAMVNGVTGLAYSLHFSLPTHISSSPPL
jgi:hypothetical protein